MSAGPVLAVRWRIAPGLVCLAGAALTALSGCQAARAIRDPEYAPLAALPSTAIISEASVVSATMPQAPSLAGPHPVDEYVAIALAQNPQVQAKRKRVEAAALRIPQAASLKDPMLDATGYPFFPNVPQTASGRKTVDLMVSQEVPWPGKLGTQGDMAEAETNMARAELVAAELEVVEQVKRAYYELYFVQKSIEITEESRRLAVRLRELVEPKVKTGASLQDLYRVELQVLDFDNDLIRLRQELQSGQARLARLLHVSPDTPLRALPTLSEAASSGELQQLYQQAILARPELHAQLAAVQRDRFATDLSRLQYYPDVRFDFGWGEMTTSKALAPTADGIDDLSIGLAANIPIYRQRLDAGVREAEAKAVASAREYDDLRDRTQEEVKDLFAQATSQQAMLQLFRRDIVPKAEQTLELSIAAYTAQKVDILQVIDNWQQLLRYQIAQQRLEAQLRQTLATLERVVGGILPSPPPQPPDEAVPAPPPEGAARTRNQTDSPAWPLVSPSPSGHVGAAVHGRPSDAGTRG
ncbi:MAG: TolC family protein [Planctomycetes bacterium]|nr:TolC family protein [Planctomycetia bacterium]MBI3468499.1 TolC family protein [Planctomycetota bacterium]